MAARFPNDTPENVALLCPICLEKYNDPRSLKCSHTFCQDCIHQHVLQQKENGHLKKGIECPLCRELTTKSETGFQPEEWSKSLPVNYALQEVITSLRTDVDLCKICQSKDIKSIATKFCFQCNRKFCDECEKTHNIFEHFQEHRIVRIEDAAGLGKLLNGLDYCAVHCKRIEFYCIDENKLCCSSCAISKHRKCNELAEITDIAGKQNKEKEVIIVKKIKELKTTVSNVDHYYDNQEKGIDRQFRQIVEGINKEHDEVLTILKEARAKMLAEANDVRQRAIDQYKLYKGQCKSMSYSLESLFQRLDIMREHGTSVQQFIALHKQEMQLEDKIKECHELFNNLKYYDMSSEGNLLFPHLDESNKKTGRVKSKCTTVTADKIPDHRVIEIEQTLSVDIEAANEDKFEPLYTGLDLLADGRLIAVDCKNGKCLVFNENLEKVVSDELDEELLDVVSLSKEDILITASSKIYQGRITETNRLRWTESIDMKRHANSISCYNDDMFVISTYDSRMPAVLMNSKGEMRNFDIKFPNKKWTKDNHICTFDEESGVLAITDSEEDKVYIYNTNTKHESVIQDERIRCPQGIAFGPNSCFFVCSSGTHSIVQISFEGDILHSQKIDMNSPYVLCFSKDNTKMAVASYEYLSKLQLYRIIR